MLYNRHLRNNEYTLYRVYKKSPPHFLTFEQIEINKFNELPGMYIIIPVKATFAA